MDADVRWRSWHLGVVGARLVHKSRSRFFAVGRSKGALAFVTYAHGHTLRRCRISRHVLAHATTRSTNGRRGESELDGRPGRCEEPPTGGKCWSWLVHQRNQLTGTRCLCAVALVFTRNAWFRGVHWSASYALAKLARVFIDTSFVSIKKMSFMTCICWENRQYF
jgi:hypothetical protein